MVRTKPGAYLSEEARLEAQRQMLAERYGLGLSDDSDSSGPPAGVANGNPNGNGVVEEDAEEDVAPSEAATYGEGSSMHDAPDELAEVLSQDGAFSTGAPDAPSEAPERAESLEAQNDPDAEEAAEGADGGGSAGWPGVCIADAAQGRRVRAEYVYDSAADAEAVAARDLRVTQITKYSNQFLESHERKIAVSDNVITYAVGGHIRAIMRNSTVRALLKGHRSAVADLEFLSPVEKRMQAGPGKCISVLGSVAEDGSVFVWKIVRNDAHEDDEEEGEEDSLTVADSIQFEHPRADEGGSYRRISFRPGSNSIVAESGIGVAMLLLDEQSSDLRVVELVKMQDKLMVRDRYLLSNDESDGEGKLEGSVGAAAWICDRVIATARGANVFLWNAESTACIGKLPRSRTTSVKSLHTIDPDTLIIVTDMGRSLELWSVTDLIEDEDEDAPPAVPVFEHRQTIHLFGNSTSNDDVYCVTSVEPSQEVIIVSNLKGRSIFALHYNSEAGVVDALTEIPVKHPVLSLCVTRNMRQVSVESSTTGLLETSTVEELGLWCVQPRGIQMIHLPARDCAPAPGLVVPERLPMSPVVATAQTSATRAVKHPATATERSTKRLTEVSNGVSKKPASVSSSSSVEASSRPPLQPAVKRLPVPKNITMLKKPSTTPAPVREAETESAAQADSSSGFTTPGRAGTDESPGQTPRAPPSTPVAPATPVSATPVSATPATPVTPDLLSASPVAPAPPPSSPALSASGMSQATENTAGATKDADAIADAMIAAATKAIETFEATAEQRAAGEKVKMDRLVTSLQEATEHNLERFVNAAVKKSMGNTVIPAVSRIIASSKTAVEAAGPAEAQDLFVHAMRKSRLAESFQAACKEMTRQVTGAVKKSLSNKYDELVAPSVAGVEEATQDLTTEMSKLSSQVQKLRNSGQEVQGSTQVVIAEPEDVRRDIEELISKGLVDEAFVTALDKMDLELVTWLCAQFDPKTVFESYPLTQISLLALAHQLGQGLVEMTSEADLSMKVEWLLELMLVLETDAEDIEEQAGTALGHLGENVKTLRKNKDIQKLPGMDKSLKMLGRLIASHMSEVG